MNWSGEVTYTKGLEVCPKSSIRLLLLVLELCDDKQLQMALIHNCLMNIVVLYYRFTRLVGDTNADLCLISYSWSCITLQ